MHHRWTTGGRPPAAGDGAGYEPSGRGYGGPMLRILLIVLLVLAIVAVFGRSGIGRRR